MRLSVSAVVLAAGFLAACSGGSNVGGTGAVSGLGGTGGVASVGGTGGIGGMAGSGGLGGSGGTGGALCDGGMVGDASVCDPMCVEATCGDHGHCAADRCSCDLGYAGDGCDTCATGYQPSSSNSSLCVSNLCGANACSGPGMRCVDATGACCLDECEVGSDECDEGQQRRCVLSAGACATWQSRQCGGGGCGCATDDPRLTASQWGGWFGDVASAVVVDDGRLAVVGGVAGSFPNQPFANTSDMFLSTTNLSDATELPHMTLWGTAGSDTAIAVVAGGNGTFIVGGNSGGAFMEQPHAGNLDVAVTKWSATGTHVWTSQWGTSSTDELTGMAKDAAGNIYVVGITGGALEGVSAGEDDAFIARLSPDGTRTWLMQWGTAGDDWALAVDVASDGSMYVAGSAGGDAFVRKLNAQGDEQWTETWSSAGFDGAYGVVALPNGECAVSGLLTDDAFISKVGADGVADWTETIATTGHTVGSNIVHGPDGDLYVVGHTSGELVPDAYLGFQDIFVRRLRVSDGAEVWTRQLGTADSDRATGIAVAANGTVYVAGDTYAAFPGFSNVGQYDALLLTLTQ